MPSAFGAWLEPRRPVRAGGERTRSAGPSSSGAGRTAGSPFLGAFTDLLLDKPTPTSRPPSSCGSSSAEVVEDPEVAEQAHARPGDRLQAALRRHRLLRDVQPRRTCTSSTCARRPSRRITPAGIRTTAERARARQPHLRHRVRRDDRRAAAHRHPRPRRPHASRTRGRPGPAPTSGSAWRGSRTCSPSPGPGSPSVLTNMLVSHPAARGVDRRLHRATSTSTGHAHDRGRAARPRTSWVDYVNSVAGFTLFPTCNSWYLGRQRARQDPRVHAAARVPHLRRAVRPGGRGRLPGLRAGVMGAPGVRRCARRRHRRPLRHLPAHRRRPARTRPRCWRTRSCSATSSWCPTRCSSPSTPFVLDDGIGRRGRATPSARSTRAPFEARCEAEWWPAARARHADPGRRARARRAVPRLPARPTRAARDELVAVVPVPPAHRPAAVGAGPGLGPAPHGHAVRRAAGRRLDRRAPRRGRGQPSGRSRSTSTSA